MSSRATEERPWQFFASSYPLTNFSQGDIVFQSDRVPQGTIGVLRDLSLIFTTSGGEIDLQIKSKSGGTVEFLDSISTSQTGTSSVILPEGARFQAKLSVTGNGVIDVSWSGFIKNKPFAKQTAKRTGPSNLFTREFNPSVGL